MTLTNAAHKAAVLDDLSIPAMPSLQADAAYLAGYRAGYMACVMTLPREPGLEGFYRVGYGRGNADRSAMHAPRYAVPGARDAGMRVTGSAG